MMSRYGGRGFYDPLSEMNRLFDQMFGGVARRTGDSRIGTPFFPLPKEAPIREDVARSFIGH